MYGSLVGWESVCGTYRFYVGFYVSAQTPFQIINFYFFVYMQCNMQNILANNDIIDHDSIILQCKIKLLICFRFRVGAKHKPASFIFYIFSVRTVKLF